VDERTTAPSLAGSRAAAAAAASAADPLEGGAQDLVRTREGGYEYVDPGGRFVAEIRPDGTVRMADRWRRVSEDDRQNGECCQLPVPGELNPFNGVRFGGLTEWLLRIQGKDLAAKAKAELLARTLDLRVKLAVAWNLRVIDERLRGLGPELLELWRSPGPVERKREQLFEWWDDCVERFDLQPGDVPREALSTIDAARVDAAAAARGQIEAFIRRHAPRGSREAYTEPELERLNARRRSQAAFTPYAPAPARPPGP
jgi:hypothetical protein